MARMRSTITITLFCLAALTASAQPLTPTISPQSSTIHDIITRGPSEVVALAPGGIGLRSVDNGESWSVFNAPDTTSTELYIDSVGSLLIGSAQGLYAEGVEGDGWIRVYDRAVDRFVASPDGSYWIVESESRQPRRLDPAGSGMWDTVPGIIDGVRDLEITPDGTVWVAIGARIYRSVKGGPFEQHGDELVDEQSINQPDTVARLLARSTNEILAVTNTGAWFSHSDSASWERRLFAPAFQRGVNGVHQDRDGTIYVDTRPYFQVSEDGLRSIDPLYGIGSTRWIERVAENDTFEFGGGRMWISANERYTSFIVRRPRGTSARIVHTWVTSYATAPVRESLQIIPIDSTRLSLYYPREPYVFPLELRRHENGRDRYWTTIRGGRVSRNYRPSIDGTSVDMTRTHLTFSRDHGRTFDSVAAPANRLLMNVIGELGDRRYLVQTAIDGGWDGYTISSVSIDDGTWTDHAWTPAESGYYPVISQTPDGTLAQMARSPGLLISRDTGRTWHQVTDTLYHVTEIYAVVAGADGTNVALGADGRSWIDMGGTEPWRLADDAAALGLHGSPHGIFDTRDGIIYISRPNSTIYRTENNGDTWTELATMPHPDEHVVALAASDHGKLYVVSGFGYLYTVDIPRSVSDVPVVRRVGRLDLW